MTTIHDALNVNHRKNRQPRSKKEIPLNRTPVEPVTVKPVVPLPNEEERALILAFSALNVAMSHWSPERSQIDIDKLMEAAHLMREELRSSEIPY